MICQTCKGSKKETLGFFKCGDCGGKGWKEHILAQETLGEIESWAEYPIEDLAEIGSSNEM